MIQAALSYQTKTQEKLMKENRAYLYSDVGWLNYERAFPCRKIATAAKVENKKDPRNDGWYVTSHVEEWEYSYYFKFFGKDPSDTLGDRNTPVPEQLKDLVIP